MNKEIIHKIMKFKKCCIVLYRGHLGFNPYRRIWLLVTCPNYPWRPTVFPDWWIPVVHFLSIVNKHFPYPYKRGLEDVEIYYHTYSTECLSWNSWFKLKFVQIKRIYEYKFLHSVVYFGLFYCLILSEMCNECGITFFNMRLFLIQIKCYSLNFNCIGIVLIAFFEIRFLYKNLSKLLQFSFYSYFYF